MRAFLYTGGEVAVDRVTETPTTEDLVIAADAGWNTAAACGATPSVLLGDFDSLGEPDVPDGVRVIRLPAEKDLTDTQLAVDYALEAGATELVIVGGLEGRLDHTLSTLAILEKLSEKHIPAVITSGKNRARFVRNSGTILPRSPYFRYFSILAADPKIKGVTVEGAKYPLKNASLSRLSQYAVSNEIVGNCALVEIRRGGAWIVESAD